MKKSVLFLMAAMMMPAAASAQQDGYTEDRLRRLERDMSIMQRQVYRGGGQPARGGASAAAPDVANLEARMTQLEEQLRKYQGQMEELQFSIRTLESSNKQLEQLLEQKTTALEQQMQGAAPAASMTPAPMGMTDAYSPAPSVGPSGVMQRSPKPQEGEFPASEREHYNQAFTLLNQARFPEARHALQSFIDRYKTSPLVGNAYYWLGETYYVERDYLKAADNFRKGYEALPEGPKAPDNLLKLGMSLSVMDKKQEACVVYDQLQAAFPNAGATITQKIQQERSRLNCKAAQ